MNFEINDVHKPPRKSVHLKNQQIDPFKLVDSTWEVFGHSEVWLQVQTPDIPTHDSGGGPYSQRLYLSQLGVSPIWVKFLPCTRVHVRCVRWDEIWLYPRLVESGRYVPIP